jgi:hypothetical protein
LISTNGQKDGLIKIAGGKQMNPIRYSVIVIYMLMILMVSLTSSVSAESKPITVTGKASIVGANVQVSRNNALKDAYRQAVEGGLGVWLSSQTVVDKNVVVHDKILANTQGYVTKYEVLNEGRDGDLYFVTIRAFVAVDAIGADFKKIVMTLKRQMDNPKISFVLTTWGADSRKMQDSTITTAFKQEFREKGFDLKATDRADEMAMSPYIDSYSIRDRRVVREMATHEGANFVARGELKVLNSAYSAGAFRVSVQVEVEVIDVNSGENIASYTNTFSAINASEGEARYNAIKKGSVEAARHLADQTISKWQERTQIGKSFTIELRNITNISYQKLPFIKAVKAIANEINSQYSPSPGILALDVLYGGSKDELGIAILEALRGQPGFSRHEFDGPDDENGKIIYIFK